jgi:TnpA family transposase
MIASDGSKYFVLQDSLQAGQSFKYFGQEQGISINSFIDARGLLWYSIAFSASTRESIYAVEDRVPRL